MDWCKELVDFLFAFMATALGVLMAFELDRYRDRAKSKAKKLKLIQSLIVELDFIVKFVRENPNLIMYTDVNLQSDVIDETIKDQLEFFDQKTNNLLKHIRKYIIIVGNELGEWAALNKSAMGTGKYPTQQGTYNAASVNASWTGFVKSIPPLIEEVKIELERERANS